MVCVLELLWFYRLKLLMEMRVYGVEVDVVTPSCVQIWMRTYEVCRRDKVFRSLTLFTVTKYNLVRNWRRDRMWGDDIQDGFLFRPLVQICSSLVNILTGQEANIHIWCFSVRMIIYSLLKNVHLVNFERLCKQYIKVWNTEIYISETKSLKLS